MHWLWHGICYQRWVGPSSPIQAHAWEAIQVLHVWLFQCGGMWLPIWFTYLLNHKVLIFSHDFICFVICSRWASWKGTSALTQESGPSSAVCAAMPAETLTSLKGTWGHIRVHCYLSLDTKPLCSVQELDHRVSSFLLQVRSHTSAISVMPALLRVAPWRCIFCRNTQRMLLSFTVHIVILSSHAKVTLVSCILSVLSKG